MRYYLRIPPLALPPAPAPLHRHPAPPSPCTLQHSRPPLLRHPIPCPATEQWSSSRRLLYLNRFRAVQRRANFIAFFGRGAAFRFPRPWLAVLVVLPVTSFTTTVSSAAATLGAYSMVCQRLSASIVRTLPMRGSTSRANFSASSFAETGLSS